MSDPLEGAVAIPSISDAYVSEESRFLDPTILEKSLIDRMPNPTGWRLLVLPYIGKGVTDGGIQLLNTTLDKENLATSVCYVLKMGPSAYKDVDRFGNTPWCKEGDWILIGRYAGARFHLEDDKEVRIINDDEVIGTIINPDDIKSS
tara:strand:- start:12853 stop:13293 length:441 start_codon:yes stop_codon:yes gene_type:complete